MRNHKVIKENYFYSKTKEMHRFLNFILFYFILK